MRRRAICLLFLAIAAVCAACSDQGVADVRSSSSAGRSETVTKLLVVVVENHSLAQMRAQMPYTFGLARSYGYANNYYGVGYPSLPNYLAITSGSMHGVSDDKWPVKHALAGSSVFGQALARGKTAALYADGMPSNCAVQDGGSDYAVKHNAWAYYRSERALCRAHDAPATRLAAAVAHGDLPNAGMVIPNLCHDAHNCPLSVADHWIRGTMSNVFTGSDWKSGHLAVVITADTDDRKANNKVLTVVVHPSQRGNVVTRRLDHYSLSGLYSRVLSASPLNRAAAAPSMSDAFGLPVG